MHHESIAVTTIVCALSVHASSEKLHRRDDRQRHKPVAEAGDFFGCVPDFMHNRIEKNQTNQPERSVL
jgi:hypothetical protein